MPRDCVGGPGQRCQSQRWSTFIWNHVKGLVVTGITAEVTRKAKARLARIQRLIQRLSNGARRRASSPMKPPNPLIRIGLDDSSGIPDLAALNRADPLKGVERGPPEKRSSRPPNRFQPLPPYRRQGSKPARCSRSVAGRLSSLNNTGRRVRFQRCHSIAFMAESCLMTRDSGDTT
jgi:hypothetical protein